MDYEIWAVALAFMVYAAILVRNKLKAKMSDSTALFVAVTVAILAPIYILSLVDEALENRKYAANSEIEKQVAPPQPPQTAITQTSDPETKADIKHPEQKKQEEPQEKTFNITHEQFRQKYNNVMAEVKIKYKMPKFKIQKGEANDVFTTYGSKLHGIVGRVDKKTGNLKGVTIICAPKDFAVGLETMIIVAASTDKALGGQKEKNFIIEMTSEALKIFNETKEQVEVRRTVGDNEYMVILNDVAGLWFVIQPKQ